MKKLIVKNPESCVGCHSCETACAKAYYKTDAIEYAVLRVHTDGRGAGEVRVCTQCGICADICPVEAIHPNAQGVFLIDRAVCIGCLACMDICPADVIAKSHDNDFATKCTACGLCARACPQKVLEIATE